MMREDDFPAQGPRAGYHGKGHIVYEEVTPFALDQRLNRLRLACYMLTSIVVLGLLSVLLVVLFRAALAQQAYHFLVVTLGGLALLWFGYYVSLMVRRLHDLGRNGWLTLLVFAPLAQPLVPGSPILLFLLTLVQPLFTLYLYVAEGDKGMNRFGTPNPPNSMLVNIFGGFCWVVQVLMLLLNVAILGALFFAPEQIEPLMKRWLMLDMAQFERLLR